MACPDATCAARAIGWALAGVVVLFTACAGDAAVPTPTAPAPPDAAQVHVFGRVVDFITNAGVSGASIDFYVSGLPTIADAAITDAAGRYSARLSRGVRYDARINGPNPDSNRGTIVPVAKETEADFLVNGGTCIVFYGTVRNAATGEPIGGASVGLDRFSPATQTAADGSYRLDLGCPTPANPWHSIGTTFMRVSRDGYDTAGPYGNRAEFLPSARTYRIDVALQPSR